MHGAVTSFGHCATIDKYCFVPLKHHQIAIRYQQQISKPSKNLRLFRASKNYCSPFIILYIDIAMVWIDEKIAVYLKKLNVIHINLNKITNSLAGQMFQIIFVDIFFFSRFPIFQTFDVMGMLLCMLILFQKTGNGISGMVQKQLPEMFYKKAYS